MLFEKQVTEIADGIILLNLQKIRGGRAAILDRIPNLTGVYSWFRSFDLPPPANADPKVFAQYLISQVESKHCLDRRGNLPPLYEVILSSHKRLSKNKQAALLKLCESQQFRANIASILQISFLFQQPLYVGKAKDLAERINDHLQPESVLRTRLAEVGIIPSECWLLFVLLPSEPDVAMPTPDASATSTMAPDAEAGDAEAGDAEEDTALTPEVVVEDVLSRLFHPLFTDRYG